MVKIDSVSKQATDGTIPALRIAWAEGHIAGYRQADRRASSMVIIGVLIGMAIIVLFYWVGYGS